MEAPEDFLNAIESGWLRLAEQMDGHLDPLVALWLARYLRAVAALSYTTGANDARRSC